MKNEYYEKYLATVGDATYIDITRRTDPGCTDQPWIALENIFHEYGAPWIVQIWTKAPRLALQRGKKILELLRDAGTTITCHITMTGLGPEWEPRIAWPIDWKGVDQMIEFIGNPATIVWRYDPIIPGVSQFDTCEMIAVEFERRKVTRGILNLIITDRNKIQKRLGDLSARIANQFNPIALLTKVGEIGRNHGIDFSVCAETRGLADQCHLESRGCGDYDWFVRLSNRAPKKGHISGPSRQGCLCTAYFDVGQYGQYAKCFGCKYCYTRY